jgi:Rrf2 family protein
MLLTRKTDYALVALAGLARRGPDGGSARDLAEELRLPLPLLRNLLKSLAASGLLGSTRGPAGGYRLARPPGEITLAEVVAAIEGPVHLVTCCPGGDAESGHRCRLEDSCRIKGNVRLVHDRLMRFLEGVTLDEISQGART